MGAVPGFSPVENGLHYPNSWPHVPDLIVKTPLGDLPLGDAANGLCGGMSLAARDLFEAGQPPPLSHVNPMAASAAFSYLVARLFDSFDLPAGVAEYYEWMQLPAHDESALGITAIRGLSSRTINDSMQTVRDTINSGHPCPLALVCVHSASPSALGRNHQVLAYSYADVGSQTTVSVYDCDAPDTEVTISFDTSKPEDETAFNYSTRRRVLGFFPTAYAAKSPTVLFDDGLPPIGFLSISGQRAMGTAITVAGKVDVRMRAPKATSIAISARYATRPSVHSTIAWHDLGPAIPQSDGTFLFRLDTRTIPNQGNDRHGTVTLRATPDYGGTVAPEHQRFTQRMTVDNPVRIPRPPNRRDPSRHP
jgi:hypothetical protein